MSLAEGELAYETATICSPRIATAVAVAWSPSSMVSMWALVRTRSAGTGAVPRSTAIEPAGTAERHKNNERSAAWRRNILLLQTCEQDGGEEEALQAEFPAGRVVPFVESMGATGLAAATN